jgi:hypothetical protein
LDKFTLAGGTKATLAMDWRAPFAGRADPGGAEQATKSLAVEAEAFLFHELFPKMMIVEAGVAGAGQTQDRLAGALGEAAVAGPAAAGVYQSRCAALPVTKFEAFHMPWRNVEQLRGSGTRQVSLRTLGDDFHSLQFLLTQRECLQSHGVTFSRCC